MAKSNSNMYQMCENMKWCG